MQMRFELTDIEINRYNAWLKILPPVPEGKFGAAGGGHWFKFTPTGLGTIVEAGRVDVPHLDINLTDFEAF